MTRGDALIEVRDLTVRQGRTVLLEPLSFALQPGQVLVVMGGSGAGKSLLLQAVIGNLPTGLSAGGEISIGTQRSAAADPGARRPLWGRAIATLPQEPMLALDSLQTLAQQAAAVPRHLLGQPPERALAHAQQLLDQQGLGGAGARYPWQISGGMAQRAALAISRAGGAPLLLADEPTKGLDEASRARALAALLDVAREGGALVVVTHDLRVAEALGGQMLVLRGGECVEQGDCIERLARPRHAFTQSLIAADPRHWPALPQPAPGAELLRAEGLGLQRGGRWLFRGLDLLLHAGERLAVLGPSGAGKSSLGQLLMGLLPPTQGRLVRSPRLGELAGQKLYQDPVKAFAPQLPLARALDDVRRRHRRSEADLAQLLDGLGLAPALLQRRPDAVSGGELQRVALARALLTRPALLFADEPSSRLDLLTQRSSLELLVRRCAEQQTALVLVTHDADIARALAPRCLRIDGTSEALAA
ncbi:MAG: ABC transporter ATP-binding protein [Methylibium sp.]|nr:ABC transporter ATP-binding protein [Methylibium sp.]